MTTLRIAGIIGFVLVLGTLSACFDRPYYPAYPAYSYGEPGYAYPYTEYGYASPAGSYAYDADPHRWKHRHWDHDEYEKHEGHQDDD
jgi:hypothetical protein